MARTVFPVEAKSWPASITLRPTPPPRDLAAEPERRQSAARSLQQDGAERSRTAEEQGYLERVQNYIPAEIVAIFIFVNCLIADVRDADQNITADGRVAVVAVLICMIACFVFARVAAKQAGNPASGLQGWMFCFAFLIWIYAIDAKVLDVLKLEPIPSLSALLLVTFTIFSGLLAPTVKPVKATEPNPANDQTKVGGSQGNGGQNNPSTQPVAEISGGTSMSSNPNRFCMCLRNKPGVNPIPGTNKAAVLREAQWTPGTAISVTFLSGSEALKARVRAVAEEWVGNGMANLSFRWVDDLAADIRIAFNSGDGSWSYLGTVCRQIESPKPTMNYGWLTDESSDADLRRVVLHEFGHALGLIHEHQSPDGGIVWNEAAVIADLSGPPNEWNLDEIKHNVLNKYDPNEVISTAVDKHSIMMYPIPAAWTDGSFSSRLNSELTDTDKSLIRQVYP